MTNRRHFLKQSMLSGLLLTSGSIFAKSSKKKSHLCILHTNDVHSHIDPFPSDHPKFPNQGGFARRKELITHIKAENTNTLLFDCGDIFQGTPYFNFYKGNIEIDLMNQMGYNAITIGNHEFDNGIEELAKVMTKANFRIVCSNYDFSNTPMQALTVPFTIFAFKNIKIGVIGLGIELEGLVDSNKYGKTKYIEPLERANYYSQLLKKDEKCDYVVCLSHLGYSYSNNKVSDLVLAKNTSYIDMILGGHTHTFLDEPTKVTNQINKEVIVNQVGWAGVKLGRLDIDFD